MSKFWTAAAVLVCAGLAQATTLKFTDFVATTSFDSDVDGVATYKHEASRGVTHYQVVLHNLSAGQPYVVFADSNGPATFAEVTVNNGGNVEVQGDINGDATSGGVIFVFAGTEADLFAAPDPFALLRAQALPR